MGIHDFQSQRLFLDVPLAAGIRVDIAGDQAHYLVNVLRAKPGAEILLFNGRDGEWRARIEDVKKRSTILVVLAQSRPQPVSRDLDYIFAPLKHARLDYMVQKAVEMGVSRLRPVFTRRTVPDRVNIERMRANVIEAAEQCGVLNRPEILPPDQLEKVLATWPPERRLIFCDESADGSGPIKKLSRIESGPLAVLIGPEGGFDPAERDALLSKPFVVPLSLGPRIMRADTAAVAALALVNATLGDWSRA